MDFVIRNSADKGVVAKAIYALPHSDKPWLVKIKLQNPNRSISQNSYYWGVVLELTAAGLGYETTAEMHEVWKDAFLPKTEIIGLDGKRLLIPKSTTELTTVEMEEYLSAIRMKASEMGIFVPLPNEIMEV